MKRDVFRLLVSVTVLWSFVGSWLYIAGIDRPFKAQAAFGQSSGKGLTDAEILTLPTQEDFRRSMDDLEDTDWPSWEMLYYKATVGNLPMLYQRESLGPTCNYVLVRNKGSVVLKYPTTCRASWSWSGFLLFLSVPILALVALFSLTFWVARGFRH